MDKLTPESIRKEFVLQLMAFATALGTEADELEAEIKQGTVPMDFLPIGAQMGRNAMAQMAKFVRDMKSRRTDIKSGVYRYREARAAQLKDEYKAKKGRK